MTQTDVVDPERAAVRLGRERRRIFLVSTLVGLAAPVVPYVTGAWETAWYAFAQTWLPLPLRAAIFLLGFHAVLSLILLPFSFYSRYLLAHSFGLSRQSLRSWAVDWLKGAGLGVTFGSLAAGAYLLTLAVAEDRWWVAYATLLSVVTLVLAFVTPYVLVPLFFRMRPLQDRATVERIQSLVARAGTRVRDICTLDFSQRTVEANAAVIGLGQSRRVVLADTLLSEFEPAEVDAIVAHELGHHVHRDVQKLLVGYLVTIWLGLAIAGILGPRALPLLSVPYLGYVPGYPVLLAVAELYLLLFTPLTNWWSRRLESAADRFALRLTRDPSAFAAAMRRLAHQNLSELRPPRWAELLLGSHPALFRRIQMAERWQA